MTTTISDGTTTLVPELVLGWQSTRRQRTRVHPLIGRPDPDVTLRPSAPRNGTLLLFVLTHDDALDMEALHTQGAVLTLSDDDLPGLYMSYVVSGAVTTALDDATRRRWTVSVVYQEVEAP